MSNLDENKKYLIQQIKDSINVTEEQAKQLLEQSNWDANQAINNFYEIGSSLFDNRQQNQQHQPQIQIYDQSQLNQRQIYPPKVEQKKEPIKKVNQVNQMVNYSQMLQDFEELEWETNNWQEKIKIIIQKSGIEQKEDSICNKIRLYRYPVGLINYGQMGYFNCVLQVLFSNDIVIQEICKIQRNNQSPLQSIIDQLQLTIGQLYLSNQAFLTSKKLKTELSGQKNLQINSKQNFKEFFTQFIHFVDAILSDPQNRNVQIDLNRFKSNTFNDQYLILLENNKSKLFFEFQRQDRFLHIALLNLIKQQGISQFQKLPENLMITLENNDSKNIQEFWVAENINLGFLFVKNFTEQIQQHISQILDEQKLKKAKKLRSNINALRIVIEQYQNQIIYPKDVVSKLLFEKEQLEKESKQYIPHYFDSFSLENNLYLYTLQTVVVEYSNLQGKHNFLYTYNFYLKQWYKINDSLSEQVNKEEVFNNASKYGIILLYVSNKQKEILQKFQNKINEFSYNLEQTQGTITDYFQTIVLNTLPLTQQTISQIKINNESFFKRIQK